MPEKKDKHVMPEKKDNKPHNIDVYEQGMNKLPWRYKICAFRLSSFTILYQYL